MIARRRFIRWIVCGCSLKIERWNASAGVGIGFIGAGNVLWAYLQVLDRLIPRGLAWEGPICARRRDTWPDILARRPGVQLVDDAEQVLDSDVVGRGDHHASRTPRRATRERPLEAGKHVVCEKPVAMSRPRPSRSSRWRPIARLHLLAAPFVQLSPTLPRPVDPRRRRARSGTCTFARGLYGNPGSTWAAWFHDGRRRPARRGRRLQPQEPDGAGGAGHRRCTRPRLAAFASREAQGDGSNTPTPTCRTSCSVTTRGAVVGRPSQAMQRYRRPGPRAVRHGGHRQPAGRRLGPHGHSRSGATATGAGDVSSRSTPRGSGPTVCARRWSRSSRSGDPSPTRPRSAPARRDRCRSRLSASETSTRSRVTSTFGPGPGGRLGATRHHLHDHTRPADEQ